MELVFWETGEGSPLIILHGLYGMSDNWVSIGRQVGERHRVIIPDQRNHGRSPHSAVHSYPAMVADLEELIQDTGLSHPVILGHSMGGKVAMQFASEHPETVSGLIVVDISPVTYPVRDQHLDILQALHEVDFSRLTSRSEVEAFISERIHDLRVRQFILKNLFRPSRHTLAWRLNLKSLSENLDLITGEITLDRPYAGPALFIRGGHSDYVRQEDLPQIAYWFPDSSVVTIEKAGHWVHADARDELVSLVLQFLESPLRQPRY